MTTQVRTLAQLGQWLLQQDTTGRMWLWGPEGRTVELPAGGVALTELSGHLAVTTSAESVWLPIPRPSAVARFRRMIEDPPTADFEFGEPVPVARVVCPHCGTVGHVATERIKVKRGISGGKATGAVLTAGWSLFATGLARKETVTQARCAACGVEWTIA